jgi:prepilin-type N-terminal cleavage/methylation domain-containing protein
METAYSTKHLPVQAPADSQQGFVATTRNSAGAACGFTLIEVLFSILVLSVGIMAVASLVAQMENGTGRSRYLSLASTYASEKIEDLNRWPTWDPHVCVPSAGTAGGLSSDVSASVGAGSTTPSVTVACSGSAVTVNYYDDVQISETALGVCETVNGTGGYTTTCHEPNGTIYKPAVSATPYTADAQSIAFHRRWSIEMDQPITGVKRVTVLVTLTNGYLQPGVSFQLSAVRP